jgi:hypothetical protein
VTLASERPGFAAPLALCMLAAVAGLAAGSFHSVVHARRAANRSAREQQAASVSDRALHAALESWNVTRYDSLPIGGVHALPGVSAPGDLSHARAVVTRLTNRLFWLTAVGRTAEGTAVEARRLQQVLVEVLRPSMPAPALTSRGEVRVGADAEIAADDRPPPGWADCPPPDTASGPAVLVPEGVSVTAAGGGVAPTTAFDPTAGDPTTYSRLARVSVAGLEARAERLLPAGAIVSPAPDVRAGCRSDGKASSESWGEPVRTGESEPCERHFPVIAARGDLVVTDGRGQGVLLVNGRLRIRGPFLFAGLILATGGIEVSGRDVSIYGAVLSAGAGGVEWLAGELRRSSCALERARDAAARPYVVRRRGWAEVY